MLYDLKTETDNLLMHVIALRKVHIPENFFLEVLIKLINAVFLRTNSYPVHSRN